MKPLNLLKLLLRPSPKLSTYPPNFNAGFSLVELTIVVLIIGVLSAIAAPGWNAFISRQRTRTVNSLVLQALQKAQSQAKLNKVDVLVTFTPTGDPPTVIPEVQIGRNLQQKLNANGEIKTGMLKLVSGVCNSDCTAATGFENNNTNITFNYLGAVDNEDDLPFAVTVSTPDDRLKRCVIVQTLLGGMRMAEGDDCP